MPFSGLFVEFIKRPRKEIVGTAALFEHTLENGDQNTLDDHVSQHKERIGYEQKQENRVDLFDKLFQTAAEHLQNTAQGSQQTVENAFCLFCQIKQECGKPVNQLGQFPVDLAQENEQND